MKPEIGHKTGYRLKNRGKTEFSENDTVNCAQQFKKLMCRTLNRKIPEVGPAEVTREVTGVTKTEN